MLLSLYCDRYTRSGQEYCPTSTKQHHSEKKGSLIWNYFFKADLFYYLPEVALTIGKKYENYVTFTIFFSVERLISKMLSTFDDVPRDIRYKDSLISPLHQFYWFFSEDIKMSSGCLWCLPIFLSLWIIQYGVKQLARK